MPKWHLPSSTKTLHTMLGANLSVRFFFGGAWFRNWVSVWVSGLILPNVVFDLHVSVSCLFGPKDTDHLSDHVHGKHSRNNVSVRSYSGKLLIWKLSVSVSARFGPPGIWADRFVPSMAQKMFSDLFLLSGYNYNYIYRNNCREKLFSHVPLFPLDKPSVTITWTIS